MLAKLFRGGDPSRRSRFHTARGDAASPAAWLHLPQAAGLFILQRLLHRRLTVPWIPFTAIRALGRRLAPTSVVLEVGSGMSTLWLADRCARLVSIEADEQWFRQVRELLQRRGFTHVDLRFLWKSAEMSAFEEFADGSLDLVIVDGGPRELCTKAALPKLRPGGAIYVDNTDVPDLSGACREFLEHTARTTGGGLYYYRDFPPGNLYVSEGMLLVMPDMPP